VIAYVIDLDEAFRTMDAVEDTSGARKRPEFAATVHATEQVLDRAGRDCVVVRIRRNSIKCPIDRPVQIGVVAN